MALDIIVALILYISIHLNFLVFMIFALVIYCYYFYLMLL